MHPDNMAAGPASYGLTDSMGRMHGDAQFAGSSSVPAHVEMMGLIEWATTQWLVLLLHVLSQFTKCLTSLLLIIDGGNLCPSAFL